jgi:cupin 2 domain-containing protein
MNAGNLFDGIPAKLSEELFTTIHRAKTFWIERIVSHGHSSPEGFWYDHGEHEWVVVLQGEAAIQFEGRVEIVELRQGSYLNIPAHTRHRVARTSAAQPTVWLAIHHGE